MNSESIHPMWRPKDSLSLSFGTSRPLFEEHGSDSITEVHGGILPQDLIQGVPFCSERYLLRREVEKGSGELLSWDLQLKPVLSGETRENLMAVVVRNRARIAPGVALKTLHGRIPFIKLSSDSPSLKIAAIGKGIIVSENGSKKETGGFTKVSIPIDPKAFFNGLKNTEGMMPVCFLRLPKGGSITNMKADMAEIIQKGRFSEERFRGLVNITFDVLNTMEDFEHIEL